jgi:hypothetical protein
MRLEVTHRFAIPLRNGFDYIVEPRNWPEYWPGLIRVQPESRWRVPRAGVRGAFDRALVRHAVVRTMQRTIANLEGRLQPVRSGGTPRGPRRHEPAPGNRDL